MGSGGEVRSARRISGPAAPVPRPYHPPGGSMAHRGGGAPLADRWWRPARVL